jgi:YD repeat-containing protein
VQEDPNGSLNHLTQYTYDGRDELKGVTQGVQSRTFTYDALKRLTSANNPESGMINYSSYDMLGNLLTKSDPNSVTVTYLYDALSRIHVEKLHGEHKGRGHAPRRLQLRWSRRSRLSADQLSDRTPQLGDGHRFSAATFQTTYDCYDVFGQVTQNTQTTAGQSFPFTGRAARRDTPTIWRAG